MRDYNSHILYLHNVSLNTNKNSLGFDNYPNRKSSGDKDLTPLYAELGQPAAETTT